MVMMKFQGAENSYYVRGPVQKTVMMKRQGAENSYYFRGPGRKMVMMKSQGAENSYYRRGPGRKQGHDVFSWIPELCPPGGATFDKGTLGRKSQSESES